MTGLTKLFMYLLKGERERERERDFNEHQITFYDDGEFSLPKPCCQYECSHSRLALIIEFGAHCVHDVAGEERHPAN